jgi:hypothetical protein
MEKEKEFQITKLTVGRNPAKCQARPSSHPLPLTLVQPSAAQLKRPAPAEASGPTRLSLSACSDPPWASSSPRRTGVVFLLDTELKQRRREGKSSPSLIFKGIRIESKPNAHRDRRLRRLRIGGFPRINSGRCRGNFYPQSQEP